MHRDFGIKFTNLENPEVTSEQRTTQPVTVCKVRSNVATKTGAGERHNAKVFCSVVPVKIKVAGGKTISIYAAWNSCADACFVDSEILNELGAQPKWSKIEINTIEDTAKLQNTRVINNVTIFDKNDKLQDTIPVVFAQEKWPFKETDVPSADDINEDYLQSVPFRLIKGRVGLIIGMNRPGLLKPLQLVDGPKNSLYATRHKCGWALSGPTRAKTSSSIKFNRCKTENSDDIERKINYMYNTDYIDCHLMEKETCHDDIQWKIIMDNTIKLNENKHYEIALPMRSGVELPSNRSQVYQIFISLMRKLGRDDKLKQDHSEFMKMMLDKQFMEKVPENDLDSKSWYLNHHSVYHKQKQKIRVVFNCFLKYKGVSLNNALYQGPDLTNNLLGVILRFRQEPVAFMRDIAKMFYQVNVSPESRNLLRFFWHDEFGRIAEYRLTVHVFGATYSPSVANFSLLQTVEDNQTFSDYSKLAVQRNSYVDDFLYSAESVEKAANILMETKEFISTAGFNLTDIVTNSEQLSRIWKIKIYRQI